MDRRRLRFLLLGLGVLSTMVFLLLVALSREGGLVYYQTVSEFRKGALDREGTRRINGKVATGSIERRPTGLDVSFVMSEGGASLPVRYHGIIPDTFVDGADVVVEGALVDGGTFHATTLLAKCPSKYEAAGTDRVQQTPTKSEAAGRSITETRR